jgi:hypothetical protein
LWKFPYGHGHRHEDKDKDKDMGKDVDVDMDMDIINNAEMSNLPIAHYNTKQVNLKTCWKTFADVF